MVYGRLLGQNLSVSGKVFEFDRPVSLIGRGKDCTIVVLDPSVSRMHTKVTLDEDGRLRVEDLRSSNGSFLNDQRIESGYLRHGDRLRAGNVEFVVELSEHVRAGLDADIVRAEGARGLAAWIVLGMLVLGAAGAGTWYAFLRPDPMAPRWFASFEGEDGISAKVDLLIVQVKDQFIEDKLDAAQDLVKKQDFDGALAVYSSLSEVVPDNDDVQDGVKKVTIELKAKKAFQDGIDDLKKENYEKAITAFKSIPKESAFFTRADTELKNLIEIKEEIKRVAENYCRRGDKIECLKFLKQAAAIDPADADLATKIKSLEE